MPTERFKRLPAVKRAKIRAAALKEFSRVPYDKVPINQIILNAGISRGSFYTYFEDKRDVVMYLMEDIGAKIKACCEEALMKEHGDYFAMVLDIFDFLISQSRETQEMVGLANNIFSYQENMELMGFCELKKTLSNVEENEILNWTFDKVDKSRLRTKTREGFATLSRMCALMMVASLKIFYDDPEKLDEIREDLIRGLEIVKYGALVPET
ncbi:MAG: TetR/AcrR family transcriptional regulator [Clostridiales bacterium]|nr:TetR/AcrR family transcriptional regulator [Clostridiales bacterium]